MTLSKQGLAKLLHLSEILYLFLVLLLFYLLSLSRTNEAHTVWEVLHLAFILTLFVASSLLLTILFTSEKVTYKLLFIIVHSVLIHSLFSIIFPAGDLSGQQMVLGRIRLIYDNAVLHGWPPWTVETVPSQIYQWFRGENFQAALSVVFSRMTSIDIFWVHLFLIPVLWGFFTPIVAFLVTITLCGNDKVAVLSSLLLSAFPYLTYFGAISVPNSLGYIFFFYSLYFMLKNLDSNYDSKNTSLMLTFCFLSFLSHSLTGVMSFSFLFLAMAYKSYRSEKTASPATAKISLAISFIFCASLLPISLVCIRFFTPARYTFFTLEKFYRLPVEEIVGLFFLGEFIYSFDLKTILLLLIGPLLALLYAIHLLIRFRRDPTAKYRTQITFLFLTYLIILIDYRILKLFMADLPFNEERLWVFDEFLASPFVALAIYSAISLLKRFLKARYAPTISTSNLKRLSKSSVIGVLRLLLTLNILIPALLAGWISFSLSAAYPQIAPLQTTWYELEAVKYIEENTKEKYVVIGDVWTIYAGEVIVGVNNPRAYYFLESNKTGHDLFVNMSRDPSLQWLLSALNRTNTSVAYFIITEPRLGTQEFNDVLSKALQNNLQAYGPPEGFGNGKLYVFKYEKT